MSVRENEYVESAKLSANGYSTMSGDEGGQHQGGTAYGARAESREVGACTAKLAPQTNLVVIRSQERLI